MARNAVTTTTNRNATPKPQGPPPSCPVSVALAIADPATVTVERDGVPVEVPGTWQPPTYGVLLPELLEQGRKAIEHQLTPAGDEGVHSVMVPLMLTQQLQSTEGMEEETMITFMARKGAEYQRHLREVPLDILKAAADACVLASPFFPTVADLFKHVRPEWEKRKRQADRLKALIAHRNNPAAAAPQPSARELESREQRLRNGIASCRRFGRMGTAIEWERELAALEGREVEEWAQLQGTKVEIIITDEIGESMRGVPHGAPSFTKASDAMQTVAASAKPVEPWRAGEPVYQTRPPEPPVPEEIPE